MPLTHSQSKQQHGRVDPFPKLTIHMKTPTTVLNELHDDLINKFDSEERVARAFIDYYRTTYTLLEAYEKHIAMEAFIEGAGVGREMMQSWMKNQESEINTFDEFKKYWKEKTTEQ